MAINSWDLESLNSLAGYFGSDMNFVFEELTETTLRGRGELGPQHHQPAGIVHGGVYATIVEFAGSMAGGYAVRNKNMHVVGAHNATDFFRPFVAGPVRIEAIAIHQGRTQQLWEVSIIADETGKLLSRGSLRLANVADEPRETGA